ADLAGTLEPGYTRAALLLRAATSATVDGDAHLTAQRIAAARRVAPDDAGVLVVSAEHGVPLDGLEATVAAAELAKRGEALATRAALADSESARDSWELDAADCFERAGKLAQ